ncbi:hypothetical protein VTO73DRAFT_2364 [Trametes versicolor]
MEKMLTVVQCFSVAIFPNLGMNNTNPDDHIHAFPEWPQNKMAWLVARMVRTKRDIGGRWYHTNGTGSPKDRRCSKLEKSQRKKLYIIVEARVTQWRKICKNLEILDKYEQEFLGTEWGRGEDWHDVAPEDTSPVSADFPPPSSPTSQESSAQFA